MWKDCWIVRSLCLILTLALLAPLAAAQTGLTREQAEEQGIELPVERGAAPAPAPGPKRERPPIPEGGLPDFLLIPDSTNDRVMSFDPTTGDLVDADFIPADATNLSTPIHAILSSGGDSILVSDQIEDVVQEYALDGSYAATGASTSSATVTCS